MAEHAKKKRRPVLKALLALVVIAGLAFTAKLTAVLGRRPSPSIDYAAPFRQQAFDTSEEDWAWPIYQRVFAKVDHASPELLEIVAEGDDASARWDEAVAHTRSLHWLMELATEATRKPVMGWPREPTGGTMISPDPDQYRRERTLARLLDADAALAAVDGDADRVVTRIRSLMALGQHLGHPPVLLHELIRLSVHAKAITRLLHVLANFPDLLDEERLEQVHNAMSEVRRRGAGISYEGERLLLKDFLQQVYTEAGTVSPIGLHRYANTYMPGVLPSDSTVVTALLALFASDRDEVESRVEAFVDRSAELAKTPLYLWPDDRSDIDALRADAKRFPADPSVILLDTMLPVTRYRADASQTLQQGLDAAIVAIALARHRAAKGAWPATLDEIDKTLLPEIPIDRFDGQPLRYHLTDEGPLLYSVGYDTDDDNGRPSSHAHHWATSSHRASQLDAEPELYDGDWVFLPPPTFDN
ncbi:MAG: hypothetical protein CMJ31_05360 [Phycisphaerae bacterium]|nr:hypothetical protein [Phycisphaerae bacterium]